MGRTISSFRNIFEEIAKELSTYRRALRGEDKDTFDQVIDKARRHVSSCSIVPTIDPVSCILLSIIIEQQKEINELKEIVNDLPAGCKIRPEEQNDNKMD